MTAQTWDEEWDVVVVGSGGAGLVAAIVAAKRGYRAIVVEKEAQWGGTTARSGGGLWIPANPLMLLAGSDDSSARALQYMDDVIGTVGPASSAERRAAYVLGGPRMVRFLQTLGVVWSRAESYPDYYPDRPGGMIGRAIEAEVFDGRRLGPWLRTMAGHPADPGLAMTTRNVSQLPIASRTWSAFWSVARIMLRTAWWYLTLRKPLGLGRALTGQLMHLAQRLGVAVQLREPLSALVEHEGRVVGVEVQRAGKLHRIRAKACVILTAGGFARASYRRRHQAVGDAWTSVGPGDTGEVILAGEKLGAATALMDDAWWGPTFLPPTGGPMFAVFERSLPGSILVNTRGQRFANESASYIDVGHAMLAQSESAPPASSWLIMDARHRRRYLFGTTPGGITPGSWLRSGFMRRNDTLEGLAVSCGLDAVTLRATVERFNRDARSGRDTQFGRGATDYDRYYSDPTVAPNGNLAAIEKAPFYAAQMVPGDLGTKGGLLTDEHARVLDTEGRAIVGLYAAGNTTASVMGRTYPGPGATLGPALTFAFIAAHHALDARESAAPVRAVAAHSGAVVEAAALDFS